MPDTTDPAASAPDEAVAAFLADVRMQAEDHRLVLAHMVLPLLAAVETALASHVEAVIEGMPEPRFRYCSTCSGHPAWPCPEVAAITAALAGKEASDPDWDTVAEQEIESRRSQQFNCSDPPEESCSDAGCPVHGDGDDADWGDEDIDQ